VPAARFSVRPHAPAYVALATLFLMSLTAWARDARDRIDEIVHGAEYVSDPFDLDPVTLSAGALSVEATAAGLRDGDIVLAVDGRPVEGLSDHYGALRRARRGDHLRLHVRSNASDGGAERDVSIELSRAC
jgi:S1-C subfamily serine protease